MSNKNTPKDAQSEASTANKGYITTLLAEWEGRRREYSTFHHGDLENEDFAYIDGQCDEVTRCYNELEAILKKVI